MIVAGEASGDLHGSNLIRAVHEIAPRISFYGLGGELVRKAGAEILVDSSDFGIIGISEVLSGYKKIKSALDLFKSKVTEDPPDLLVLIDYPEFNLRLAEHAKRAGIPVLYYISPQVWAWRKGRVKKIARIVDRMAVVFPFEVEIYEKAGLDTRFVGHPLLDAVKVKRKTEDIRRELCIGEGDRVVGLLPGSRKKEIMNLLPSMLESAEIMHSRSPEFRFLLPVAPTVERGLVDELLSRYDVDAKVVEGMTYEVMKVCDMAFIASGTATLEAAIIGMPVVVVYKVSSLSYLMGRLLIDMEHISLPNIVAGREIVPELIQDEANPGRMVDEAFNILFGKGIAERMKGDLKEVREKLGGPGASGRTAELVVEMV